MRQAFEQPGPESARFPGLMWPLTVFALDGAKDIRPLMDAALDNCRRHGDDWGVGMLLMFRTHMAIDVLGGVQGVDEALAELRVIGRRAGDRWIRAQVSSASAETAMAQGRYDEARAEYEESLRLAHEVGAYAETPFLMARLAELAYHAGDRAGALIALDEAGAAADRHGVADSRAFIRMMRAQMALDAGEIARARELCDRTRAEILWGTPPPQFIAAVNGLDALITAAEDQPGRALEKLTDTLREAMASRVPEVIVSALVDGAAQVLVRLGDHRRAARLLGAATADRDRATRPIPRCQDAERCEETAIAELGRSRYEAERATGAGFTFDDILRELDGALAERMPARATDATAE